MLMGTNFADGKGNVTAFVSYRHADPVKSNQRDYGACQLSPIQDAHNNVVGVACGGSSNSNFFKPVTGPTQVLRTACTGTASSLGEQSRRRPRPSTTVRHDISLTREDNRYNAALMAHAEVTESFQPYAEFFFMDDKTQQQAAPAALFQNANPLDPTGAGDYYINCSNPLLSVQQQAILCTPAQVAADKANPGSATAQVIIGRRNIEGGARYTEFRAHQLSHRVRREGRFRGRMEL